MVITDYAQCGRCHTRVIYPVTPAGQCLGPVNFGPDQAGNVAVRPTAAGEWEGWFLDGDEGLDGDGQRFRLHECQVAPLAGVLL